MPNSWIKEVIPKTAKTLKTLEPIKFPSEILFWPFARATIDVTSSGSEVPRATTVIPITNFGTSKNEAIEIALSTNNSEPEYNPIVRSFVYDRK